MGTQFAAALRQRLERIAKKAGKPPHGVVAATAGITKEWLNRCLLRNTFDRARIEVICRAAGWEISTAEIEDNYEVLWTKPLSDELQARIKQQGIPFGELATEMGLSRGGLDQCLRRNRFEKDLAERLCKKLDFGPDNSSHMRISQEYDVDWAKRDKKGAKITSGAKTSRPVGENVLGGLMEAFSTIDAHRKLVTARMHILGDEAKKLFNHMQNGDFLVFISSTVEPLLTRTRNQDDVSLMAVDALNRGARIVLLCPTKQLIEKYYRERCGFHDKLVPIKVFQDGCDAFRSFAQAHLSNRNINHDRVERITYGQFGQFEVNDCPFFMPDFAINLFGSLVNRVLKTRITIRLPGDELGGVLAFPQTKDTEAFHKRVEIFVRKELNQLAKRLRANRVRAKEKSPVNHSRTRRELQIGLVEDMNKILSEVESDLDHLESRRFGLDT